MKKYLYFGTLLLCINSLVEAQVANEYKKAYFKKDDFTLPYRILYPIDYDSRQSYPLVLFLHGAGERGADDEKQLVHGSKLFLNNQNHQQFPAPCSIPQCPKEDFWYNVDVKSTMKVFENLISSR